MSDSRIYITKMSRSQAWLLFVSFFGMSALIILVDAFSGVSTTVKEGDSTANLREQIEMQLGANSAFLNEATGRMAETLTLSKTTNRNCLRDANQVLYFRPHVEVCSKQVDLAPAIETIVDFKQQLAQRGVKLLVLPVPVKAMTKQAGEFLFYTRFKAMLDAHDVAFLDVLPVIREFEYKGYLDRDTHWRPETVSAVAGLISENLMVEKDIVSYQSKEGSYEHRGDLELLLDKPGSEILNVRHVLEGDGQSYWSAVPQSEVLLLGDSFTNIYSTASQGCRSAGLAEQLSFQLQAPIDRLSRNDDGAIATRLLLKQHPEKLTGCKVVVWEFVVSQLLHGDWSKIKIDSPDKPEGGMFLELSEDECKRITGSVSYRSAVPNPNTVLYKDHILTMILTNVHDSEDNPLPDVVCHAWSMKDRALQPATQLQIGDTITCDVSNWQKQSELHSINRSEPDDRKVMFSPKCWLAMRATEEPEGAVPVQQVILCAMMGIVGLVGLIRLGSMRFQRTGTAI